MDRRRAAERSVLSPVQSVLQRAEVHHPHLLRDWLRVCLHAGPVFRLGLRVASTECYSDDERVRDSWLTFPSGTGAAAPDIHFSREAIACGGRNQSSRSSK